AMAMVRGFGALLLIKLHPSIQTFFLAQIMANTLTTILVFWALWSSLPRAPVRPRFELNILKQLWRFALSMAGITVLEFALTQMDKFVLSRTIPLSEFTYYT